MNLKKLQNHYKIILFSFITIIVIMSALTIFTKGSSEKSYDDSISIGISEDTSSLIVNHMIENESMKIKPYIIKDCCAKTAQWAILSDVYPMAIVCGDAAEKFTKNNKEFVKVATVFENSNILLKRVVHPKNIGVVENKESISKSISKIHPNASISTVNQQNLPYALESNNLDSIVLDITRVKNLKGQIENLYDKNSFVLIAKKEFIKSYKYKSFIKNYNKSVKALNNKTKLCIYLRKHYKFEEGNEKYWKVKILEIN